MHGNCSQCKSAMAGRSWIMKIVHMRRLRIFLLRIAKRKVSCKVEIWAYFMSFCGCLKKGIWNSSLKQKNPDKISGIGMWSSELLWRYNLTYLLPPKMAIWSFLHGWNLINFVREFFWDGFVCPSSDWFHDSVVGFRQYIEISNLQTCRAPFKEVDSAFQSFESFITFRKSDQPAATTAAPGYFPHFRYSVSSIIPWT